MSWLVIRASPSPQDQTARALELTAQRGLRDLALSRPSHGSTRHELPTTYYTSPFSRGSYDAVLDLGAGGTNRDACFWGPIARDNKTSRPKTHDEHVSPVVTAPQPPWTPFSLLSPFLFPHVSPRPEDQILAISSKVGLQARFISGRKARRGPFRFGELKVFFSGSFLVGAWFVRPGSLRCLRSI